MSNRGEPVRRRKASFPDPLSEADRDRLAASLYKSAPSFASGVAAALVFSAYAFAHTHASGTRLCASALAASALARAAMFVAYHVARRRGVPGREPWTRAYLGGAVAYAASAGCLAGVQYADTVAGDPLRMLSVVYALGYSACVAGRNAGWPIVSQAQVLGCSLPVIVGVAAWGHGDDHFVLLFTVLLGLASLDTAKGGNLLLREAFAANRERERGAALLDVAVSNMSHALLMVGDDGRVQVANARLGMLLGTGDGGKGMGVNSFYMRRVAPCLRDRESARGLWARAMGMAQERDDASLDLPMADGRTLQVWLTRTRGGVVAIADDVTAARAAHARTERMAYHDAVTDLPNRRLFLSRLAGMAAGGRAGAVLCIDLDRFKHVNDTLGHPVGDRLLVAVAGRLSALAGPGDLVSRFGGDEFAILQDGADRGTAERLAAEVVASLGTSFDLGGARADIGGSVGIALLPAHGRDAEGVLAAADAALYASKAGGRGSWHTFDAARPGDGRDGPAEVRAAA